MLRLRFRESNLDLSRFSGLDIKGTVFDNCSLAQTDFTKANLSLASFTKSNLKDATFENTNLEKADFTTAIHFNINPNTNRLKAARFSREELSGLLTAFGLKIE